MGSAGFMAFVHPDADVRAAGHAADERLERWAVDLPFDPQVAAAVTELAAHAGGGRRSTASWRRLLDVHRAATSASPGTS